LDVAQRAEAAATGMGEDGDRGSGVGQGDAKRARTSGEVAPQEAAIIDGAGMAAQIRAEVAEEVKALKLKAGRAPGLAVVIVGERKDSQTYVRNKVKACSECGIASTKLELPESTTEAELIEQVRALNADPLIDGILVQLPLPAHITESKVLDEITLDKDVDGFHPSNLGLLAKRARKALAVPCTPLGVMEMLSRSGVTVQGANAVVIGRSDIVGIPVSFCSR
jgi:5,10-methylene-tetrahydrofolate dehydrogenase/methenyl tetrahydrofolate cyclohydrolase